MKKRTQAIILAAGQSTRMITDLPKVLHEVCGRPMLAYVLDACRQAGIARMLVVVGYQKEKVLEAFPDEKGVQWVVQSRQSGTADAVKTCRKHLKDWRGNTMVLCGDAPLVRAETIKTLIATHEKESSAATLATAVLDDPTGYGRIIRDAYGNLEGIVEEVECTPQQREIREINPSYYCFDNQALFAALSKVKPSPKKKEYYLTDVLGVMVKQSRRLAAVTAVPPEDVLGINSRRQLAAVSEVMKFRILDRFMASGVTIVDPDNTWIDARAQIGQDTVIRPFTFIHGRVRIGKGCQIGPFAYLREGTVLADDVVLGVFTEVKNSQMGSGTRVRHLSYIGDSQLGRQVNIGAGAITANFDGEQVRQTIVGDNAFVGQGSVLVAPLKVKAKSQILPGAIVEAKGNCNGQKETKRK